MIFLQHLVMDVLNGFEPGHAGVMDVMGFVVEYGQLFNFADDLTQVGLAVRGFASGLCSEWGEKVIA